MSWGTKGIGYKENACVGLQNWEYRGEFQFQAVLDQGPQIMPTELGLCLLVLILCCSRLSPTGPGTETVYLRLGLDPSAGTHTQPKLSL